MALEQLAQEANLHEPTPGDWRIWPLEDDSFPDLASAVAAYLDEYGRECKGADVLICGSPADWIVTGPQSSGADTYMSIAGACAEHRSKIVSREMLGSDDPSRVEAFDIDSFA